MDTLTYRRSEIPGDMSYRLPKIEQIFLGKGNDGHNAIADAESLNDLISNICQNTDFSTHLQRFS